VKIGGDEWPFGAAANYMIYLFGLFYPNRSITIIYETVKNSKINEEKQSGNNSQNTH
jgi:hypothetical protein